MMDLDEAIKHCRKQVQEQAKKGCYSCAEEHHQLSEWLKELKAYREKLNCTDCIIDGTDACSRGAGRAVDDEICGDFIPNKSEIPTSCGDAISRQAVLDAMYELCDTGETLKENPWRDNPHIDAITDAIENLPSVTPQQRTGRWIEKDGYDGDVYYDCSVCGESWASIEGTPKTNGMKYCPNCGAKMEVEE